MGHYSEIMTSVESTCSSFISQNVSAVANGIKDPAFMLLSFYILLWGFTHLMNLVQEPITDAIKRFLKIIVIFGVAFQMATYNSYIVDTFTNGFDQLAGLFGGASGASSSSNLDSIFQNTWNVGTKFWNSAGIWDNMGFYFVGLIIWLMAAIISAYSAYLIILSKVAIAILVALGPLFIISTLFESTKSYFNNWLGMLCNYGFVLVLVIAVNSFMLTLYSRFLGEINLTGDLQVISVAPIIITSIISVMVLSQIPSIAQGLGGGAQLASMGAMQALGNTISGGLTGVRAGTTLARGASGFAGAGGRVARTAISSLMKRGGITKG